MLYESCKLPIRVTFFGFTLIALGYLILNDSVNIFYTITNPFILSFAQIVLKIGQTIITALPLFFMTNLVAKKANSGVPIVMAIIGYITFLTISMLFSMNSAMSNIAYSNNMGISYVSGGTVYYPLQTGMLGSFMVAFVTRYAYIRSRNRSSYSFLGFLNKDTAGIIYVIFLCGLLGFGVTLVYPICYGVVQDVIAYVAKDLSDPMRLGVYGFADRVMSILGLGNMIRQPFWFGVQGGSYMTISGQTILGDVAIWEYIQEASGSYAGCGRFITPYYIINIFLVPSIYLGMFFSMTDAKEKQRSILLLVGAITLSVCAGNPLPLELLLLFTSPLLLLFYLAVVMILFIVLPYLGVFLGFAHSGSTIVAMPGSLPDYVIGLRNPLLFDAIFKIFVVGIAVFIICFIVTVIYYRRMAYNLLNTNKTERLISNLADAVGGLENIRRATSGVFKLNLYLIDLEAISFNKLSRLGATRITETKEGVSIAFGSSSTVIAKAITKEIAKLKRQ